MDIDRIKTEFRLQQWTEMARVCMTSGKTVRAWCKENGICDKTYYYRLRKVREAACRGLESSQLPVNDAAEKKSGKDETVFAELDLCRQTASDAGIRKETARALVAVTVRMGNAQVDVYNGADSDVIAYTLRVMGGIC